MVSLSDQRRKPANAVARINPRWLHPRGSGVWWISITVHCGIVKDRIVLPLCADKARSVAIRNGFISHLERRSFESLDEARAWLRSESILANRILAIHQPEKATA